jgi:hypothetical protein
MFFEYNSMTFSYKLYREYSYYVVLEITVLDVLVKLPGSCNVLLFILADSLAVIFCATTTPTHVPAPINIKNKNANNIAFIIL